MIPVATAVLDDTPGLNDTQVYAINVTEAINVQRREIIFKILYSSCCLTFFIVFLFLVLLYPYR